MLPKKHHHHFPKYLNCHLGVQEKTPDHISHITNISDTSVATNQHPSPDNDQKRPLKRSPRPSSHAEKRAAKPTASSGSSQAPLSSRESFHFKVLEKVLRRLLTIIPFNPWNPKRTWRKSAQNRPETCTSYIQLPHIATPILNHTVILSHTPYASVDHDAAEDWAWIDPHSTPLPFIL